MGEYRGPLDDPKLIAAYIKDDSLVCQCLSIKIFR